MTDAQKLIKIAEDESKLIGYNQNLETCLNGGVVDAEGWYDESKIIKKTVSGNPLCVDDVSEIYHRVAIQLTSDTVTDFSDVEVKIYGKNLIPFPYVSSRGTFNKGDTYENNGITYTVNNDNSITLNGTATGNSIFYINGSNAAWKLKAGKYAFNSGDSSLYYYSPTITDDVTGGSIAVGSTFECKNTSTVSTIRLCVAEGKTVNNIIVYPQIEMGVSPTNYEPYTEQTVTANADGTVNGIKSMSPTMTLVSFDDVSISMTYHKSWGMQIEYDRFWDDYQNNGNRTDCKSMFAGSGWNNTTINPKYDIYVVEGTYVFYRSGFVGSLKEHFERLGKKIDFSNCQSWTGIFQYAQQVTETPYVDMSKVTSSQTISSLCTSCLSLVNAEIKFSPLCSYNGCFNSCIKLENLIASGTIAGNGLDLHWSTKLTPISLKSIVDTLSTTTSGLTITLPSTAEANYNANPPENAPQTWAELRATRNNWTISLI